MTIRTFIFCDICNPVGLRTIDFRRNNRDGEDRKGRRLSDGRAWFEGNEAEATQAGWLIRDAETHVCPNCKNTR